MPAWHAFSTDNTITFKRKEIKCEACAMEADLSKHEKEKAPGVRHVMYAVPEDGFDKLPGRTDYYKRLQRMHEAEMARKQKQE